ncbi:MAG: FAD-dependent oxidoreductase, partial [Sulfolobales archaeon]
MSFRLRISGPAGPVQEEEYDVVVVGAGPAGLSAALYSARYRLKTLLIGETIGGQLANAGIVDDYPGLIEVEASELIQRFVKHVSKHGVPIVRDRVEDIKREGDFFKIYTRSGRTYRSRAVIIAVGLERKKLGVPGEAEYAGRGVSYCTVCDVPFFKGKRIVIVGGGNAGVTGAIHAVGYASKIYLVTRGDRLRAFPVYIETLNKYRDKVEIILNSTVVEIGGDKEVRYAVIKNLKTGETRKVDVEGVFIEIGNQPPTEFFKKIGLEVDEKGLIDVKPGGYTNIEGIFAAGDCAGGKNKYYYQ